MTEQEKAPKPVEHAESADMEDILSSIKSTVEEETAKAEDGLLVLDEADVVDGDNDTSPQGPTEERINLDAFADSGEVKTQSVDVEKNKILDEVVGESANPPVPEGMAESEGDEPVENAQTLEEQAPEETAADLLDRQKEQLGDEKNVDIEEKEVAVEDSGDDFDIDALLAAESESNTASEEPQSVVNQEVNEEEIESEKTEDETSESIIEDTANVDELLAAAELTEEQQVAEQIEEPVLEESSPEDLMNDIIGEEAVDASDVIKEDPVELTKSTEPKVEFSSSAINLPASASEHGLQIAFPSEVLAEALRPLVKSWVEQNLPNIVERLVKEELEKLASSE